MPMPNGAADLDHHHHRAGDCAGHCEHVDDLLRDHLRHAEIIGDAPNAAQLGKELGSGLQGTLAQLVQGVERVQWSIKLALGAWAALVAALVAYETAHRSGLLR